MRLVLLHQPLLSEFDMPTMYRKHDSEHVVDVDNVWPLIPVADETYQAWLAAGNQPLERDAV